MQHRLLQCPPRNRRPAKLPAPLRAAAVLPLLPVSYTHLGQNSQLASSSVSKKISLKMMTLNNSRQKINDCLGNPVEIGIAVIWRVTDTAKPVFNVDNYKEYLSLQCDSALRNVVRVYPYDAVSYTHLLNDAQAKLRNVDAEAAARRTAYEQQAEGQAAAAG